MKLFYILLIGFVLSSCGVGFVMNLTDSDLEESLNMIFNSGFENGDYNYESIPPDWVVLDDKDEKVFWDNEIAHNGSKSLKFQETNQKFTLISEAFPLNTQAIYHTRCYVKAKKLFTKNVQIFFHAFDKNGKEVNQYHRKMLPDQNWKALELTSGFLKSSAKFGRVTIMIPHDEDNSYWIDDVKCYHLHSFQKRK